MVYLNKGTSGSNKWRYYLRKWYVFLLSVLLFVGIGYYYLNYVVTPLYRISSTVLLREEDDSPAGTKLPAAFGELNLIQPISKLEDEIEIFRSDSLLLESLADLNQFVKFYVNGEEVYENDLPVSMAIDDDRHIDYDQRLTLETLDEETFRIRTAEDQADWSTFRFGDLVSQPYGTFTVFRDSASNSGERLAVDFMFLDPQDLRDEYQNRFGVSQINLESNVLNLGLIDPIPARGVDLMNRIIERYKEDALVERHQLAMNTIELIDERLLLLTRELSGVEANVENYKQNNELTNVQSDAQVYVDRANDYSKELGEYQLRIDILNSVENYLNQNEENFSIVPSSLSIDDPTLQTLIGEYNQLLLERQELLVSSTAKNPLVLNLEKRLTALKGRITENITNIKRGLVITRENLQENSQRFRQQIRKVPSIERDLTDIQRQQSIKNNLYYYLLQKREESVLSLATGMPAIRVLSPPRASNKPVQSKSSIVYISSLLAGLFLPFLLLQSTRKFFGKIESPHDVREHSTVPLIAKISHDASFGEHALTAESDDVNAELFRLLFYELEARLGADKQVITVTSAKSGEGKTFVSNRLGATMALLGKRVVVVSGDLRKQQQGELNNASGLTTYLTGEHSGSILEMARLDNTIKGLVYLPSGPKRNNPAQLMRAVCRRDVVGELRREFDYIIIDTAPIGLVSDALALTECTDACLFVIRNGVTEKEDLEIVDEVAQNGRLSNVMAVLNDDKTIGKKYGYGG